MQTSSGIASTAAIMFATCRTVAGRAPCVGLEGVEQMQLVGTGALTPSMKVCGEESHTKY